MQNKQHTSRMHDDQSIRRTPLVYTDKLHRRNPRTVRQEIQSFNDIVLETTHTDIQLTEMPGLQNLELWKRIAERNVHVSPPLSRHYYQTTNPIQHFPDGQILEQYLPSRRSNTTIPENDAPLNASSSLKVTRQKIFIILLLMIIMGMIIAAVVVTVILVRKPAIQTTDYYSGIVTVQAHFDPTLLSLSTTLSTNYEREFCSLISSTLSDRKTKYAIFYSDCGITAFRNGSIIAHFILGFTRYQNLTRLNSFLSRTIVNKQLFGGNVLSIIFNFTTTTTPDTIDYNGDYEDNETINRFVWEESIFSSSSNKYDQNIIKGISNQP